MPQQPVCPREVLTAAIALVGFFTTVDSFVSVEVIALNEPHITGITGKRLFSCVCQYMSLQVIAAPEGPVTMVTDKILLNF